MYYVKDSNILTSDKLCKLMGVARSQPPRQVDLDSWVAFELQPDIIPTDDIYQALNTASLAQDGLWYRDYSTRAFTAQELSEYQEQAITRINLMLERKVELLADKFPAYERQTWAYQLEEAKAWLADNTAPTPLLDNIILPTDTMQSLCDSIVQKEAAYSTLATTYVGIRRAKRDEIRAATGRVDIDAIVAAVEAL